MVKLKDFFGQFRKKKEVLDSNSRKENFIYNVIPNIKFGDIIISKDTNLDYSLDKNVLVVIGKTDNDLLCYLCETVRGENLENLLNKYQLFKNGKTFLTPFSLKKIDYNSFVRKANKLSSDDRDELIMSLKYHNTTHKHVLNNFNLLYTPLIKIRDIVKKDNKYYLVLNSMVNTNRYTGEVDSAQFWVLPIEHYNGNNLDLKSVNYEKAFKVTNDKDLKYVNTISRDDYGVIAKKYYKCAYRKNELIKGKNNNTLKRGYVVSYNEKYYYIYYVNDNNAYGFEIILSDEANSLVAGNTKFKPLFDNKCKIDIKKDIYKFLDVAYSDEIFTISERRIYYLKQKALLSRGQNNRPKIRNYNVGEVLEHIEYPDLKFIVIGVYLNKIITINFDDFIKNGSIDYNEFDISDNSLYLSNTISDKENIIIRDNLDVFNSLYRDVSAKKRKRVRE